jgi:alcohol dehydrogenase
LGSSFDIHPLPRLVHGVGVVGRVGELARELGFRRVLLVADRGMVACGYVERVAGLLSEAGMEVLSFQDFSENPDSREVELGRQVAEAGAIDSLVALGGGSSLDCAKGINFLVTGGGVMADYRGHGQLSARVAGTARRMRPMIGIPTTAGTGSEAQSFALISDHETHVKMACGDEQASFRVAILDPELTLTQPRRLTAVTGYDAISHAVESYVTRVGNTISRLAAREAWRLLDGHFERVLDHPDDLEARAAMQLGAWLAGVAIEGSMLGATHSCANPLTKNFGTPHGEAIALMLPHVVRWNQVVAADRYHELLGHPRGPEASTSALAARLEALRRAGDLPESLTEIGVREADLDGLAAEAGEQWTGRFNPRPWTSVGALEVYREAL